MSPQARALRVVAVAGTCLVLVQQAASAFPLKPRQDIGFVVPALAAVAVPLVMRLLLPDATRLLLRHKDLLVPLGLLVLAEAVFGWLLLLPTVGAVLSAAWPLKLWVLSFSLSVAFAVTVLLHVAYGAWATTLVLDVIRRGRGDPVAALPGLRRWFWRVLGLDFLGWGGLFAGLAVGIALAPLALPLALLVMAVGSLLWNLATAALLPAALDERLTFWEAFRQGVRASWAGKGQWWLLVVAQLVLLGWVTFLHVSYSGPGKRPGSFEHRTKTNWGVNAFWTGGYEDECRWYGKLMEAVEAPKVGLVSTALGLVFGVLAVGIKLDIARKLEAPPPSAQEPSLEITPAGLPPEL